MPVRLLLSAVQLALALCVGAACLLGWSATRHDAEGLAAMRSQAVAPLLGLKVLSDAYAVSVVDLSHKVRNGGMGWDEARAGLDKAQADIARSFADLDRDPPDAAAWAEVVRRREAAETTTRAIGAALAARDSAALEALVLGPLYRDIDPLTESLGTLADSVLARTEARLAAGLRLAEWYEWVLGALVSLALLVSLAALYLIRSRISRPLAELTRGMAEVAEGRLDGRPPHTPWKDELGAMGSALGVLRDRSAETVRLRAAQEELRLAAQAEQARALRAMADAVERETADAVQRIGGSVDRMTTRCWSTPNPVRRRPSR
ncbi:MAG: hypothetical protein B7Z53_04405 [Rhodospirillales bacterium 12-71-4]|nr:MAG: hypothetical protein B7Z53_04405 [Rhodospirillales bacterium 12-71-4]